MFGVSGFWTNAIDVTSGEWVTYRFIMKKTENTFYRITTEDRNDHLYERLIAMNGGENDDGLIVSSFKVPDDVNRIRLYFPSRSYIEGVALYRGVKVKVTKAGSLFSDNDTSFGCNVDLAPPCLLYTSPSPRDRTRSRMPSSA